MGGGEALKIMVTRPSLVHNIRARIRNRIIYIQAGRAMFQFEEKRRDPRQGKKEADARSVYLIINHHADIDARIVLIREINPQRRQCRLY